MDLYTVTVSVETPDKFIYNRTTKHDQNVVRDKVTFETTCYNLTQGVWDDVNSPAVREELLRGKLIITEHLKRSNQRLKFALISTIVIGAAIVAFVMKLF